MYYINGGFLMFNLFDYLFLLTYFAGIVLAFTILMITEIRSQTSPMDADRIMDMMPMNWFVSMAWPVTLPVLGGSRIIAIVLHRMAVPRGLRR